MPAFFDRSFAFGLVFGLCVLGYFYHRADSRPPQWVGQIEALGFTASCGSNEAEHTIFFMTSYECELCHDLYLTLHDDLRAALETGNTQVTFVFVTPDNQLQASIFTAGQTVSRVAPEATFDFVDLMIRKHKDFNDRNTPRELLDMIGFPSSIAPEPFNNFSQNVTQALAIFEANKLKNLPVLIVNGLRIQGEDNEQFKAALQAALALRKGESS